MGIAAPEPPFAPVKQAEDAIGVPSAVPHPPSQEVVPASNAVPAVTRRRQLAFDGLTKRFGHPFISIDVQNPVMSGQRDSRILLLDESDPWVSEYLVGVASANLHGTIRAS